MFSVKVTIWQAQYSQIAQVKNFFLACSYFSLQSTKVTQKHTHDFYVKESLIWEVKTIWQPCG